MKKNIALIISIIIGAIAASSATFAVDLYNQTDINALLKPYSSQEYQNILFDKANIESLIFRDKTTPKKRYYLATAGAPGATKSTILETYLNENPRFNNFVYIDPDQRGLRFMFNTYISQSLSNYAISKYLTYAQAQRDAYNYWRNASNFIAGSLINQAFDKGYNIAHGTTSTNPKISKLFTKLKSQNYKIVLLLCYADDRTRQASIRHRSKMQGFYQATTKDVLAKGAMFPQRFVDYFQYADEIILHWVSDFKKVTTKCAVFKNGKLHVIDQANYDKFVQKYESDRRVLSKSTPSWKQLISGS